MNRFQNGRYQTIIPLLIILLALLLRLPAIGRESLWMDEAISYLVAYLPIEQILNNAAQSSHPPLYYLFLYMWKFVVPDTDSGLRLLNVFWNLLLLPAVYLLTMAWTGKRPLSLLAAFIIAISPFQILYSHELRMYAQLMTLITWSVWAYWQARKTGRWNWWLLFTILMLTAVYTHLFALLVLAAIGIFALVRRENKVALRNTIIVTAVTLLLFLPWAQLVLAESQKGLGSLRPLISTPARDILKPLLTPAFLLFGMASSVPLVAITLFLMAALLIIWAMEARKQWKTSFSDGAILLGLILLFVLGVPLLVYIIRPFFLPERTMAAAAPFLAILLAWSITRKASPLPYLVGASILVMLFSTAAYHFNGLIKPPYRDVMALIESEWQPNDIIMDTSDGSYLPALRYMDKPDHLLLANDPDPRKPESVYNLFGGSVQPREALPDQGRLWLIVALEHSWEWPTEQANYFAESYELLQEYTIEDFNVRLYQLEADGK